MAGANLDVRISNSASSFIEHFAYDMDKRVLEVGIKGIRYRYYDVPIRRAMRLLTSVSDGKAFNNLIKNRFRRRKLPGVSVAVADFLAPNIDLAKDW